MNVRMRRLSPILAILVGLALIILLPVFVSAKSSIKGEWEAVYTFFFSAATASCQLCHGSSTKYLNGYGLAIQNAKTPSGTWTDAINAVEANNLNSDADTGGWTDLEEINANTQPGWTPGDNTVYSTGDSTVTKIEAAPTDIGPLDPPPPNSPPVLDPVGSQWGDEETLLTFTATASDPDVGDSLVFSLVGEPTGAVITAGGGVFSWTPTETQGPGDFTFDVVVSDGTDSDSETITVTVVEVNVAPVVANPGAQSNTVGDPVSLGIVASDADVPVNTLTYTAVGLPSGLVINPTSGLVSGTVTTVETANVTVTVTDDGTGLLSDSVSFTWTVDAPEPEVVDLDIADFRVNKRANLNRFKGIKLTLVVKNEGTVDAFGTATIIGTQGATEVYKSIIAVSDPVGNGRTRFVIKLSEPGALVPGPVTWTVTLDVEGDVDGPGGDTATASTRIVG